MNGEFDQRYTAYQTDRGALRRLVRRVYLRSAAAQLQGPTLDFGCGVGELLERLPAGSKGLEYNRATVDHCRSRGLDVDWYDGYADDWRLTPLRCRRYESMVISHVLEHFVGPEAILSQLLRSAGGLGVRRVLAIVPGRAGYRIDDTHRTFVDRAMLADPEIVADSGFSLQRARYFPGDIRKIGDWFPHHELQALFVRRD
jgi:SAM-dependent methyltransferase